jgi:hypothetical protein
VGWRAEDLRGHQVLPVHGRGLTSDAGCDRHPRIPVLPAVRRRNLRL